MRFFSFIILFLFSFGCQKKKAYSPKTELQDTEMKNGLPVNPDGINAYLHAGFRTQVGHTKFHAFATFNEDPANLISFYDQIQAQGANYLNAIAAGSVSVGPVTVNNKLTNTLSLRGFSYYYQSPGPKYYTNAVWVNAGRGQFPSLNDSIPRGFPKFHVNTSKLQVVEKNGGTLDLNEHFSNFDSAIVVIREDYLNAPPVIKRVKSGDILRFSSRDFHLFQEGTSSINSLEIILINYTWQMKNNRLYVFSLSSNYLVNPITLKE